MTRSARAFCVSAVLLLAVALLAVPVPAFAQLPIPVSVCDGGGPLLPGQSLGPIVLDMPLTDAITLLGPPQRRGTDVQYGIVYSFAAYTEGPNSGLTLQARDGKISYISMHWNQTLTRCHTPDLQVYLGALAEKIEKVLGKPEGTFETTPWSAWWSYETKRGLLLMVNKTELGNMMVQGIDIFRIGTACDQINAMNLLKWTIMSCGYLGPQDFPAGAPGL
jgi:hypothetical protein